MYDFTYRRPSDIEDAKAILAEVAHPSPLGVAPAHP